MSKTKARHKRPTPSRTRQGVALGVTTVVSAGAVVAGAGVAEAADNPVSQSRGWFLSGSALGVNLDDIVELDSAAARNTGSPATVTSLNPLGVTLLNSLNVPLGPVNLLGDNGLIKLGAVNQAAIARSNGSAIGASGAVTDSGAIAVGGQSGVPAANATVDLEGALGGSVLGSLADLDLEVGALAASAKQAKGEGGAQTGDYRIAQLRLTLESPLLAGVLGTLGLGAIDSTVADLVASIEALDVGGLLGLDVTGLGAFDNLAVDSTLGGTGPVQVNLTNGTVVVDVEALLKSLGLDLNNLPPNTEIVNLILDALTGRVVDLVVAELERLVQSITAAVDGIGLTSTLPILAPLQATIDGLIADGLTDLLAPVTGTQNNLLGPGSDLLDPLFAALDDVLSLVVNVQSRSNGEFTQRALRVSVLPASNLATVNLASASVGPGQGLVAGEDDDETTDNGNELPDTGAGDSAPLAAAGLALMLAGAAASAGANRMGNTPAGAHAGPRGRGSSGGGRHARR